jgi:hypothetical protein
MTHERFQLRITPSAAGRYLCRGAVKDWLKALPIIEEEIKPRRLGPEAVASGDEINPRRSVEAAMSWLAGLHRVISIRQRLVAPLIFRPRRRNLCDEKCNRAVDATPRPNVGPVRRLELKWYRLLLGFIVA